MKWYEISWVLIITLGLVLESRRAYLENAILKIERDVFEACLIDVRHGLNPDWRWEVFNSVSQRRMFWKFWKTARSFWADKTFDKISNRS